MLLTKNDTIIGDLVNNKIEYLKSGRTIDFKEERDDYQKRELLSFINAKGLNHLLQPCTTCSPDEYGHIETTIAPEVLDIIVTWLKFHNP